MKSIYNIILMKRFWGTMIWGFGGGLSPPNCVYGQMLKKIVNIKVLCSTQFKIVEIIKNIYVCALSVLIMCENFN